MPVVNEREYRSLVVNAGDDYIVEGNFTTYDSPYLLYSYDEPGYHVEVWEQVRKGAFDDADLSDVIMQYDHQGRVFARLSNDTLALELEDTPHMIAKLGGTEIGRQLYEEIKGGYTNKMSWGFTIKEDSRETSQETNEDGSIFIKTIRSIDKVKKVYDVSAVSLPANDQTDISARNFGEGVSTEVLGEIKSAIAHEAEIKREESRKRLELKLKLLGG